MKKRVVAFVNSSLLPKLTMKHVKKLNSACIAVIAFHSPDILILDTFCPPKSVGKEIDAWAQELALHH